MAANPAPTAAQLHTQWPAWDNIAAQGIMKFMIKHDFMNMDERDHRMLLGQLNSTPGTTWYPINRRKLLGSGGEGIVQIWYCLDRNSKIVDRVVVKECVPGATHYNDPLTWMNGIVGGVPMEVHLVRQIQQRLAATSQDMFVARCFGHDDVRGARQPQPSFMYKIYYEYCELGDFVDVLDKQQRGLNPAPGRRRRDGALFPESFIWYLFESLAKVAVAMEALLIIHGDMQAGNVLLGMNRTNHFKVHPTPKVHDFGSGLQGVRPRNDYTNKAQCFEYAPPELSRIGPWLLPNATHPTPVNNITTRANVWQVGMIMACAMRLEWILPEKDYLPPPAPQPGQPAPPPLPNPPPPPHLQMNFDTPGHDAPLRFQHPNARYSTRLIQLVRRCMQLRPANRPSATQLLRDIQNYMAANPIRMVTHPPAVPSRHRDRLYACVANPDRYRIGKRGTRTKSNPHGPPRHTVHDPDLD